MPQSLTAPRQRGAPRPAIRNGRNVSPRTTEAAARGKLAELKADDRNLRVFETTDPNVLAVIEKSEGGRRQYAIERDEGLVADLRLFAEASRTLSDQ